MLVALDLALGRAWSSVVLSRGAIAEGSVPYCEPGGRGGATRGLPHGLPLCLREVRTSGGPGVTGTASTTSAAASGIASVRTLMPAKLLQSHPCTK